MELSTAVRLIRKGVASHGVQVWADLGAGSGLFTKALSTLLHKGSTIHAVDKDARAIGSITLSTDTISLIRVTADITGSLKISELDGIIIANALHYIRDKGPFLNKLKYHLRPEGRIVLIEYDSNKGNAWVPFPISYAALTSLIAETDFSQVIRLEEEPSRFRQGNLYSALIT